MTIAAVDIAREDYTQAGTTTSWPFSFEASDASELRVLLDGVETTNFSITGAGDENGGTVVISPAVAIGTQIVILRKQPIEQQSRYQIAEAFPAQRVERDLDKLVKQVQMLEEMLRRTIAFAMSSTKRDITIDDPVPGGYFRWKLDGTGIENPSSLAYDLGNFLQSGTGAVARTAMSKIGELVSVKDFDAQGDGVTPDAIAIRACLLAHDGVIFTSGNYVIEDTGLVGRTGQTIILIGDVTFTHTGSGYCWTFENIESFKQVGRMCISGTSAGRAGVYIHGCPDSSLDDIEVWGYDNMTPTYAAPGAATVALAGTGAGSCTNGDHIVKVSFITDDGETALGTASATVTVVNNAADGKIAVSAIPIGPAGTIARKIWMTHAGGADYYLASRINNNTAVSLELSVADAALVDLAHTTSKCVGKGVHLRGETGYGTYGLLINRLRLGRLSSQNGINLYIDTTDVVTVPRANADYIHYVKGAFALDDGVWIDGSTALTIGFLWIEDNAGYGLFAQNVAHLKILSGHEETNTVGGIHLYSTVVMSDINIRPDGSITTLARFSGAGVDKASVDINSGYRLRNNFHSQLITLDRLAGGQSVLLVGNTTQVANGFPYPFEVNSDGAILLGNGIGGTRDWKLAHDGTNSAKVFNKLTVADILTTLLAISVNGGINFVGGTSGHLVMSDHYVQLQELAADPDAPATNNVRVYLKDNGAGKSQLCARFATGAVQQIALEP